MSPRLATPPEVVVERSSGWLTHLPDRLMHGRRRARAMATLASMTPPTQVLFVCLANLCRSPYAAAAAQRDRVLWPAPEPEFSSAGLIGTQRSSPDLAIEVAAERAAPLGGHRSTLVTRALLDATDLIVVMEAYQIEQLAVRFGRVPRVLVLGDFDPQPITTRAIPDPWNKSRQAFASSYERIDRCLLAMALTMQRAARARRLAMQSSR